MITKNLTRMLLILVFSVPLLFTGCGGSNSTSFTVFNEDTIDWVNNGEYKIVQYDTMNEAHSNYLSDITGYSDVIDVRYMPLSTSLSIQDDGIHINVDTTNRTQTVLEYGGPHISIKKIYEINPYVKYNAIVMRAIVREFSYNNYSNNLGGGVNFGLFLQNFITGERVNIVIGAMPAGGATTYEIAKPLFDPTTNTIHISTIMDIDTKYCTSNRRYIKIGYVEKEIFYTKVTKDNFRAIMHSNGFIGLLEDFTLTSSMLQIEVEEEGGDGYIKGIVEHYHLGFMK